jgi:signal transduction histidine kinase
VVKEVDSITISSLNLRLAEGNGQDEIARLAHTFNNMLARLENAFKMQKNFIANASHELRTPLTAITGQLEVLLLKERNEQEYLKTITSVLEDMKNLNLTSNRLLLLAQASSETAESVFKLHRIDEIAWQVRSEILKRNPNYTVQIEFDMEEDDFDFLEFKGNELLIKTCILNLIENACKYSENHTSKVVIKATKTELQMQFTDEGIGIEKDDLAKIFEPFHRGKNAITYRGHGIGLSLVKRIVELHKGEISINSKLGEGTSVLVKIPR